MASNAMTNRSLRTIRNELEFLADSGIITDVQLSNILSQLPNQPDGRSSIASPASSMANLSLSPSLPPQQHQQPASNGYATYNEKRQQQQQQPSPAPSPAPPAYPAAPQGPPALCYATALYAYPATDAGDLALTPNERVAVTEYMNAEWWKGRSEKTGQEGIFPRTYVRTDEKIPPPTAPLPQAQSQPSNYGNMPLDVSQGNSGSAAAPGQPNKGAEMGKKFGKKLGNAAIFGAGATIGGNIVNSIF